MSDRARKALRVQHKRCRYCQTCMLACSMYHENGSSSLRYARLGVERDLIENTAKITVCRNCKNPKCMDDCPPGAMRIGPNGVVMIDDTICTACGNCKENCPFGAVVYIERENRYMKCDQCEGRSEGPLCVEVCPVHAIDLKSR